MSYQKNAAHALCRDMNSIFLIRHIFFQAILLCLNLKTIFRPQRTTFHVRPS